ncbi:hypothetical protein [Pandoraea anhela]|uniref:hypothetical protein n=1 Tax=Pandoraea anhela TaxID=2508295 RepID=UPI0015826AAB|nr:hypothetical protein [Pandoraea anhela]
MAQHFRRRIHRAVFVAAFAAQPLIESRRLKLPKIADADNSTTRVDFIHDKFISTPRIFIRSA